MKRFLLLLFLIAITCIGFADTKYLYFLQGPSDNYRTVGPGFAPMVRVVATTESAPSNPANPYWHLAENDFVLNGSLIAQWNDSSGNGRHATQTTESYQPSLDGTSCDFGGVTAEKLLNLPVMSYKDDFAIFFEIPSGNSYPVNPANYSYLAAQTNSYSEFHFWKTTNENNGNTTMYYVTSGPLTHNNFSIPNTSSHILGYKAHWNGSKMDMEFWADGTKLSYGESSRASTAGVAWTIGNHVTRTRGCAEITAAIAYDRLLTDEEMAVVNP